MKVVVQKYGGSSVSDVARIRAVARRIVQTQAAGYGVVVAVSAMGNTTNELLRLARSVSEAPGRRELDMLVSVGERISMTLLSMAVTDLGAPAVSFTGSQSGIITDEAHTSARIVAVRPHRIQAALEQGKIVIVAGFQGVSRDKEVTTLGRGGTDLTAVALAAALGAEWCEICSDVDGVYSADPRVVPDAIKLDELSLDEALAMARNGARVLQADAVALAHRLGIELQAVATSEATGTGSRIQVEALPPRFAAVTSDTQLERIHGDPLELLGALSGVDVRRVERDAVVVDTRNWHDRASWSPPPGGRCEPIAQVVAVATGPHVETRDLLATLGALEAAGVAVIRWDATPDSLRFETAATDVDRALRVVHGTLVAHS